MNLKPIEIANKLQEFSGVNPFENSRQQPAVEIRSLLCYLLREKIQMRWTAISNFFTDNNKPMTHASAIHAVKTYPINKKHNKKLLEYERMFQFKSDLNYDQIDKIHYLENKVRNLEKKLVHPLLGIIKDIPEDKYDEVLEFVERLKKGWAWKQKVL